MQTKPSGRRKFLTGIFQFLWAELKTMNRVKLKCLYKIGVGYVRMKYFGPKKIEKKKKIEKAHQLALQQETYYRLSS